MRGGGRGVHRKEGIYGGMIQQMEDGLVDEKEGEEKEEE